MDNNQMLAQLLAQQKQKPESSPLDWLKSFVSPNTTAGALGNQDQYNAYAHEQMLNGSQPMGRMEYLKMMSEAQ